MDTWSAVIGWLGSEDGMAEEEGNDHSFWGSGGCGLKLFCPTAGGGVKGSGGGSGVEATLLAAGVTVSDE